MTEQSPSTQSNSVNLPADVEQVTYYRSSLARESLFPTAEGAYEFGNFVRRVAAVDEILGSAPEVLQSFKQHDRAALQQYIEAVKELVAEFDSPASSLSNVLSSKSLVGTAALLQERESRGPFVADLVMRLAFIDVEGREWAGKLTDIPPEIARDKTFAVDRQKKRS